MSATAPTDTTAAEEFVAFFAEGWQIGATDPERFFAHFGARVTPDARKIQPLAAEARGPEGLRELFTPVFEAVPDLRVDVLSWGVTAQGVMIEIKLHGTLGSRPLEWEAVDRIVLRDGLIAERRSYFDPLPLVASLLKQPRASAKLVRALIAGRRRS
ncbi:MAG TPA: nuclear transport factor 2 family protein [Thermoleophilaceae bacterium]|nr:nuclear transport factor 2 family protein [Thermoleophilaceae bacterium]